MGTDVETAVARAEQTSRNALRDSRAIGLFGSWMLVGLFLDGWAHANEKPETFFSPWHGVLYSGFVAALAWFAWMSRGRSGAGAVDRLASRGLVMFVVGAVGDGVWHEIFGIEVDIEALLSPTHLLLMTGGLLMVSAPFRAGWKLLGDRPSMRDFAPTLASVTLVVSLLLFFLMYLAASDPIAQADHSSYEDQGWGIASVLVRTAVMIGAALLVLRRWTPPRGTFVVLFTAPAIALAGLDGFEAVALAVPFLLAGGLADVIVARDLDAGRRDRLIGVAVPPACWLSFFAVHAAFWGVHWPAEVWTGAIVFATLTGFGLAVLSRGLVSDRAHAAL